MSEIRRIPEEDFNDFINIASNAYPGIKLNTQEEKDSTRKRFIKIQKECDVRNFYGLYRNEKLLGGMILYDFHMNFVSTRIKAGGVGFVAVDLLHKKEKVAKEMITYFLRHYREKGAYMALLYPFRPDFYKKMGFGFGSKINQYKIRPSNLPRGKSKEHIYFLNNLDRQDIIDCYNRVCDKTHGMIQKNSYEIENVFNNPENKIVGYKKNGSIMGYIVFSFKGGKQGNFISNDIHINELIYEDREVLFELLTFLHTQKDQIRYIIFNIQDEYFHHLLCDPRNGSDNIIPSVYHETNTHGIGIMYRVIDVKEIFKALSNHNFGNQSCKVKLAIIDTFLEENSKSTVIHFKKGTSFIKEDNDNDYDVEISLDISHFSSLLMGVVSFKGLYKLGLADISDINCLDVVNKIFATEDKPICTTPF